LLQLAVFLRADADFYALVAQMVVAIYTGLAGFEFDT
jgi:hypothetical protein